MASVREIAKDVGVSITTVSRVLNNSPHVSDDVKERVLAAANRTRYTASVGRKSNTNVCLLYTDEVSLKSPFDAGLIAGIYESLDDHELDLMILDVRRLRANGSAISQALMKKGVRGAIVRTTSHTHHICEALATEGFPAVVVGDRMDHPLVNTVYADSRDTSREAVNHLLGLGHHRIVIALNVVEDSDHADRLAGYEQAHADHQIAIDRRLILRAPATRNGGAQLLRRVMMMHVDRPTAIFVTDPLTAAGLLAEAARMNVVIPRDLSVVGFDDSDLRFSLAPELTAVCQDASELGRRAVTAVLSVIAQSDTGKEGVADGPPPQIRERLRTWLEIHGTTAVPGAARSSTI
jgi:LacI family transcriptional regulator